MYILRLYFSDEIEEMKVSNQKLLLKKYVEEKFDGTDIYKEIFYNEIGEYTFVYGDGEEIGVIGKIEKV